MAAATWLPRGRTLPDAVWAARHRAIVAVLWLHVVALPLVSLASGKPVLHSVAHALPLVLIALAAVSLPGRALRAAAASFGLLTASALLVHITGGLTEAHFHFFVVISIVTLYEDWRTFLLAFAYVVVHHAGVGLVHPAAVFDHVGSSLPPWAWAGVHGLFVGAAGVANVVAWRANEAATELRTRGERRRADEAMRHLAALVESTDDAVVGKTPEGIVTAWNPGAERLFGRTAADMLGRSITTIVPEELWEEERRLMERVVCEGRLDHYETRRVGADGAVIDVSLSLSVVRDGDEGSVGLVGVARDISERKRLDEERRASAERMRTLALEDDLTGLGNFRAFHDALDRQLAHCRRHGGELSVLMFDLDGFKGVNDRHGHAEGDRVLRAVADVMRARGRGADMPCRLGGDEFALLLPATDRSGATAVGDRIREGVRAACAGVDISFGVAVWPEDGAVKDDLLAHADTGLYATKALRPGTGRRAGTGTDPREVDAETSLERLLDLARTHLGMDVAVVGRFDGDREVVHATAGDAAAFGLDDAILPLEDTYCRRVVDGRLPNVIADARHDERVKDLAITTDAGIGAYVGVPLTLPDGELYGVLCCVATREQPDIDDRDVKFLGVLAHLAGQQLARAGAVPVVA